ncbi:MAG TPA: adenylate/guanylate cyclase domain-containing protein [Euzebyales bacterium]|nr:adenylate/guanylate cyclase domain-containing protein [Euzebyales bacterium]
MTLPTGTVTFLFTDIEASTRLLTRDPERYPAVVAAQRAVIAHAARERGGVVFGYEGDACFVAFADAAAAIDAAGAAQRALAAHPWPGGQTVRVRMGLHTGAAELRDDDYYGLAVHVVARVVDAAYGRQVLLSDATRSAGVPDGWTCTDLGSYRLRGIDDPVRLHQLEGQGLASAFPPVRTLTRVAAMPAPASTLVGRQAETNVVLDLLMHHRIVTLLGPGGIGKTRLAINVGWRSGAVCPDAVWFADLTRITDPSAIAGVVADAVDVTVTGHTRAVPAVAEAVADKRALLIVDNVEHVIDGATVLSELIDETPHLRVLVTSRERLRLSGEQVYDVEPLGLQRDGAAVRLFVDRARSVRPDIDPTAEQRDAILKICTRLDGLPLAIELAAAQCRLLQPTEILQRLHRRPLQLSSGSRDVHQRQQTIRNTIAWSYQLLTPDEQALLVRLPVFSASMRLDAIAEILGDAVGDGLDDALGGLVDKSLLHHARGVDDETRLRMLELVREFAGELLGDLDDLGAVRARHAASYTSWVDDASERMLRAQPDLWVRRIDTDFPDLARAFEWNVDNRPVDAVRMFGALGLYFRRTGAVPVAGRWMRAVRDVDVPAALDIRRAITCGFVLFGELDLIGARREFRHALDVARAAGDVLYEAHAMIDEAHAYLGSLEDYERALAQVRHGTDLARSAGASVLVAIGCNVEGELSRIQGDDDTAEAAYRAAIELGRATGDHQRDAVGHGNRVYIATHRGDLDEAVELARYAVDLNQRYGHRNELPWVAIALAGALVRKGRVEDAAVLVASAEATAQRLGLREVAGDVPENERIRALIAEHAGDDLAPWRARGRIMPLDEALRIALGARPAAATGARLTRSVR